MIQLDRLETAIWSALEPHIEGPIHLDLNELSENAAFGRIVAEVADSVRDYYPELEEPEWEYGWAPQPDSVKYPTRELADEVYSMSIFPSKLWKRKLSRVYAWEPLGEGEGAAHSEDWEYGVAPDFSVIGDELARYVGSLTAASAEALADEDGDLTVVRRRNGGDWARYPSTQKKVNR